MEKHNLTLNINKSIILALRLTVINPPLPDSHNNTHAQFSHNLEKVESREENLTVDKCVTLITYSQAGATHRLIVIARPTTQAA